MKKPLTNGLTTMTTIACNKQKMISDSKVSMEHKGISYPAIKIIKIGNTLFGAAGTGSDCSKFLKWAGSGFKGTEPKWIDTSSDDQVVGLIVNEDGIYIWEIGDKDQPEKIESEFFAIGSGGKAARAAMILGSDPVQAVEIACQVDDLYSGLPLQIIER